MLVEFMPRIPETVFLLVLEEVDDDDEENAALLLLLSLVFAEFKC